MIRAVPLLGSFFVYVQKGHTFPVLPVLEVSLRFAVLNSPFLLWGDSPPANFSYLHKAKAKVKFSKTNHRKDIRHRPTSIKGVTNPRKIYYRLRGSGEPNKLSPLPDLPTQ